MRYSHPYLLTVCLTGLLILNCMGCQRGKPVPDGMPIRHPCTVSLTLDGVAEEETLLYFYPVNVEQERWYATGCTDKNGNATMKTLSDFSGVPEGEYKVTILKTVISPDWKYVEEVEPPMIEPFGKAYSAKDSTPLSCTVVSGRNHFDFALTSDEIKKLDKEKNLTK